MSMSETESSAIAYSEWPGTGTYLKVHHKQDSTKPSKSGVILETAYHIENPRSPVVQLV